MKTLLLKIAAWWEWQQVVLAEPVTHEMIAKVGSIKDNKVIFPWAAYKIWYRDYRRAYIFIYRY